MFAIWPSGWPAGAGCRNPARPAALAGRERAGECGGGSRVRFGGLVQAETRSAMVLGGGQGGVLMDKTRIHLRSASVRTYTFFTTGFPRFLSIRGARGLLALNQVLI
jgi:hypothetical protein